MPKEKDAERQSDTSVAEARPEEEPGKARFIRGEEVVNAEGKVVEGLSVGKDGAITGTEKKTESK